MSNLRSNFLQSREWLKFQNSLGREVLEYEKEGVSAKIIKHDIAFGKNYLYAPHGPVMDFNKMIGGFKNPVANFTKWLHGEAKKRKSIFVKAEPLIDSTAQVLIEYKFKKSKKEIQPAKTVIIDLTQSEEDLLSRMHHKTRYNIGVADKHNVVVGETEDLEFFLKLIKKTAKRAKFHTYPDDYYRKLFGFSELQKKLYFAAHGDKPLAAALVLIYGDTGYYLHGASDYAYRYLMAPYALHWHIIKMLQSAGLKKYDMWGINAKKWPGVTRFKLGFGGQTIEYPGSFDLVTSRFWYLIYGVARKLKI